MYIIAEGAANVKSFGGLDDFEGGPAGYTEFGVCLVVAPTGHALWFGLDRDWHLHLYSPRILT